MNYGLSVRNNKRPPHIIQIKTWNLMKSNCKPASNALFSKCASTKLEAFTPSEQRTHFPCDLSKYYIMSNPGNCILCMIQTWGRINIYLLFPAQHSIQFSQMITKSTQINNWLISQNILSLHFYFHRLMTAVESLWNFLHMLHGEMLPNWSRDKHWCPDSSDANQVC